MTVFMLVCSCSNNKKFSGSYIFSNDLEKIKIGLSRTEVESIIGKPNIISYFDKNKVYYYYEKYQSSLFHIRKIYDARLLILSYSNNKIVKIKNIDNSKNKNITIDKSELEVYGYKVLKEHKPIISRTNEIKKIAKQD